MNSRKFLLCLWMVFLPVLAHAEVKVQEITTDGLTIWLVEDHTLPVIETRLLFKGAGYVTDPADKQGRAALAESLFNEGAGDYDSTAFTQALEEKAIQLSSNLGQDHLSVSLKTLTEHREQAFALMADMLTEPRFDPEEMDESRRKMQVARARQQESPYYLAGKAFAKEAYAGHPYAQEQLGSDESMATLTREDLETYRSRYLTRENLMISVVGDITADEIADLMREALADLPQSFQPEAVIKNITFPKQSFYKQIKKQLPQTVLVFSTPGIDRDDERYYAAYLLNYILGGGTSLTSVLGEEVRRKRGLSYGIGTYLEDNSYSHVWAGSVATQNETANEARAVIIEVLGKLVERGISPKQLQTAKDYITGSFALKLTSNGGVSSYLMTMQLYDLGSDYLNKRNDYFESVTIEQMNQLVQEYFPPERWSWVRVGQVETEESKEQDDEAGDH